MNVVFLVCCDGDTYSKTVNPDRVVLVNVNTSNCLLYLLMNNEQTIEVICAHLHDGMVLAHKGNQELYFTFRLKSCYLHAIYKYLLNHKTFDMELHLIREGFKIQDSAIINLSFESGRLEDIESKDYDTLSKKKSYDKILWVKIIDKNMIIVLTICCIAYRLSLSCLVILKIKNSSDIISLNDLINNISNNGSSANAYNDLIYTSSSLNIDVIIQTLYDVLELNINTVHYRIYNSLLIIYRSNKIADDQVNLIVDYVSIVKNEIHNVDDLLTTKFYNLYIKEIVKLAVATFKNIVDMQIHHNDYTSLCTKNDQMIIETIIRIIQFLMGENMCIDGTINLFDDLVLNTNDISSSGINNVFLNYDKFYKISYMDYQHDIILFKLGSADTKLLDDSKDKPIFYLN